MLQFKNNLELYTKCSFSKERFLVMKETVEPEKIIETNEEEKLKEQLEYGLKEFRNYVLDKIHPPLARIIQQVQDALSQDTKENYNQTKLRRILEGTDELKKLIHTEIPQKITLENPHQDPKAFVLATIFKHCFAFPQTINNTLTSIFYDLEQINSDVNEQICKEFNTELREALNIMVRYHEACKKNPELINQISINDDQIKNQDPFTKEIITIVGLVQTILKHSQPLETFDKGFLAEKVPFLEKQLNKKISPEIKQEIETTLENINKTLELTRIREDCLKIVEIDFDTSDDLSHLNAQQINDFVEIIRAYHNDAQKVLFALTPEEKGIFLEKLKSVNDLISAQTKNRIPEAILQLMQTMQTNPVFSN